MTVVGKSRFHSGQAIRGCALAILLVAGAPPFDHDWPYGGAAAIAQETDDGSAAATGTDADAAETSTPESAAQDIGSGVTDAAEPTAAKPASDETGETTGEDTETNAAVDAASPSTSEPAAETAAQPAPERVPEPPKELRVATWSGAYREAQDKAVFSPFTKDFGIKIKAVTHAGGVTLLDAAKSEASKWDIADVPFHVAKMACEKGHLQKIDPAELRDTDDKPVDVSDFLDGAISPCAVGTNVWSSVIAFDSKRFKGRAPTRLEDFFDIAQFPGKRGLPMRPRYVLEMALMADGVAPDKIYETLETDEGTKRALAKLDTIRKRIVWWQSAREPAMLLMNRKVAMAVGFNGRFYMATAARDAGIELLWDGQIYDLDVLVIPKTTQHMPTAMKFLSYAIRPKTMAAQASWLPYGPARRSAAKLVDRHASLPVELTNYLPTAPDNFGRALRTDEAWWDRQNARLVEKFRNWLDGKTGDETEASEDTPAVE